jgi:hypothetical protein
LVKAKALVELDDMAARLHRIAQALADAAGSGSGQAGLSGERPGSRIVGSRADRG